MKLTSFNVTGLFNSSLHNAYSMDYHPFYLHSALRQKAKGNL